MPSRIDRGTDRSALLAQLARHRLFRCIAQADLEAMIATARQQKLAARAKLFAAGDPGQYLYIVMSGWIKLSRDGPNGRALLLEVAGRGTVFGELAIVAGLPRTADAAALVETTLLAVDGRSLLAALRPNPDALLELIRMLGERLVRANTQTEDTVFLTAEARLARTLIRLAALEGAPSGEALQIDLGLSQKEFGEMTGLSRESTNKQLSLWRETGLVAVKGHTLALLDVNALSEIANAVQ